MPADLEHIRGVRFSAGKCPVFSFQLSTFELWITNSSWGLDRVAFLWYNHIIIQTDKSIII